MPRAEEEMNDRPSSASGVGGSAAHAGSGAEEFITVPVRSTCTGGAWPPAVASRTEATLGRAAAR